MGVKRGGLRVPRRAPQCYSGSFLGGAGEIRAGFCPQGDSILPMNLVTLAIKFAVNETGNMSRHELHTTDITYDRNKLLNLRQYAGPGFSGAATADLRTDGKQLSVASNNPLEDNHSIWTSPLQF